MTDRSGVEQCLGSDIQKETYIVIAVHNRIDFTNACLKCLQEQSVFGFRTIIVDDGSTDGTSQMIESEFPEVILLHGDGNLWWAGATNKGVQIALDRGASYIITLNDDTLPEPTWMADMTKWIPEYPDALIGSSAVASETGELVYGGERANWLKAKSKNLLNILPESERKGLHWVSHFPGRGLLIPAKVFREIGVYDEKNFPHTFADYDFTIRAWNSGYKLFCNYDAKLLIHSEESATVTTRKKKSLSGYWNYLFSIKGGGNLKNFIIYAFKNCPKRYLTIYLAVGLVRRLMGYLVEWIRD
jgi:GT2 family glycosyltransferase